MSGRPNPLTAALEFISRGLSPIPIPHGEKGPKITGWQNLSITAATAPQYFNSKPQNIGLRLGAASAGLVDVDLDCAEAVALAPSILPETKSVFGRKSKRCSHYFFKSDFTAETKATLQYKAPDGIVLLELRIGSNAQTVVPPSIHPSGEPVEWFCDGDPAAIDPTVLKAAAGRLAAASLLVRNYPAEGGRHQLALTLGGYLARMGWPADEVGAFVETIALAACDDEIADRRRAAADAVRAFAKGKPYGSSTLEDLVGEAVERKINVWVGCGDNATHPEGDVKDVKPVEALIAEFNSRYMVINEYGKAIIYEPQHDLILKRRFFSRFAFQDFRRLYQNRLVRVGNDGTSKAINKPVADVWLHHPDRKQYVGGVVFDPSGQYSRPDTLNLWQGFAVKPLPGCWQLLKDHVLTVICSGNQEHFNFLICWIARLVQQPAEQGEVAIVLKGGEGTGKGTLAKALLRILGHHGLTISNSKHLTGHFNGHLRDVVFLFADEAFFAGDKAHVGVLKALITEPTLTIEAKYQNAVQMPNFVHLMMASNEDWVVPASLDARRFFVLEVSPERANDHPYFEKIWNEMEAGGFEAMLHDLQAYDLTTFNHRSVPVTVGLQIQRKLSLRTEEDWWNEVLLRGYVFKSQLGMEDYFSSWHEEMATEVLFASYTEHAKARREWHPMGREAFGKFMVRMGAVHFRPSTGVIGEHIVDVANASGGNNRMAELIDGHRPWSYRLGDLAAARIGFEKATELRTDWPADESPEHTGSPEGDSDDR